MYLILLEDIYVELTDLEGLPCHVCKLSGNGNVMLCKQLLLWCLFHYRGNFLFVDIYLFIFPLLLLEVVEEALSARKV